jgi:hypothetical protein
MTVHPPAGLSESATRTACKEIESYLSASNWQDGGYADLTAQIGRKYTEGSLRGYADDVFENCPYAGRIVFVYASDTSNSGQYWYVERNDGQTEFIDQWSGYEGARGNDAAQRVKDEHGVRGYASFEA